MLGGIWVEAVALVAAFVIAVITTPAGVSGAVLLLPFQVSVLGTPSPSVTPTNLLYNVVACPGAMWRYWRQGQTGGSLTWLLLAGTLPGVIAGSVIRVYVLPGPVVFDFVVAAVLIPLASSPRSPAWSRSPSCRFTSTPAWPRTGRPGSRWGPVAWPGGTSAPACTRGCQKNSSGACSLSSWWRSASASCGQAWPPPCERTP